MSSSVTPIKAAEIIEAVITRGDLANLTPEERGKYYVRVCESVGLNPMTRPFEYITLNGKLTLYARKDATDQLRKLHKVSVTELAESEHEGVWVVTAKVRDTDGRTDGAKGAVSIAGLKGEALANALMKAETKAKRRATLSLCGLGFLDETEVEDIPGESKVAFKETKETMRSLPKKDARPIYTKLQAELDGEMTSDGLGEWHEATAERRKVLPEDWQDILQLRYQERLLDLRRREIICEQASTPAHDAHAVIWEENGERPATPAEVTEVAAPDPFEIPPILRREVPQRTADVFDEKAWLSTLTRVFDQVEDVTGVKTKHTELIKPQMGRVSTETYQAAEAIARGVFNRIAGNLLAA